MTSLQAVWIEKQEKCRTEFDSTQQILNITDYTQEWLEKTWCFSANLPSETSEDNPGQWNSFGIPTHNLLSLAEVLFSLLLFKGRWSVVESLGSQPFIMSNFVKIVSLWKYLRSPSLIGKGICRTYQKLIDNRPRSALEFPERPWNLPKESGRIWKGSHNLVWIPRHHNSLRGYEQNLLYLILEHWVQFANV